MTVNAANEAASLLNAACRVSGVVAGLLKTEEPAGSIAEMIIAVGEAAGLLVAIAEIDAADFLKTDFRGMKKSMEENMEEAHEGDKRRNIMKSKVRSILRSMSGGHGGVHGGGQEAEQSAIESR